MNAEELFFDGLKKNLEILQSNPKLDNEATRHDLLVYPFLTNQTGLNWKPNDIWAQSTIIVPYELTNEYYFSGGIPKSKRPDLIIRPFSNNMDTVATVIEEKEGQKNLEKLGQFGSQLTDYLGLFKCTWGILTDGEKWIIKKGFEDYLSFASINELQKNLKDFRQILGRDQIIERYVKYKTFDLIYFRPHLNMISNYAATLIGKCLPAGNAEKIYEEIALLFIAFLDKDYEFELRKPNIGYAWTHKISWQAPLHYLIEIITIISKEERCKRISLERHYGEDRKEWSRGLMKAIGGTFNENEKYEDKIRSDYLLDSDNFGFNTPFDEQIQTCYGNQVKLFYVTGA